MIPTISQFLFTSGELVREVKIITNNEDGILDGEYKPVKCAPLS